MRCARVDSLLDRFVDGTLDDALAARISGHAGSCARCAGRLAAARRLADGLAAARVTAAPAGFTARVMAEVYRRALAGGPKTAGERALPGAGDDAEREARRIGFYRRLGLTFMLSAGLLAASLLIPRASYPTLLRGERPGAPGAVSGPSVVKDILAGAGRVVEGTLGDARAAPAAIPEGGAQ